MKKIETTELVTRGRSVSTKAIAAYATYQKALEITKKVADSRFHMWSIDQDYTYDLWEAGCLLAHEHQVRLPGARRQRSTENEHRTVPRFESNAWVNMRVPGVAQFLQARTRNYDTIEFRAPRLKDLEALEAHLREMCADKKEERPELDLSDYVPDVVVMSWSDGEWDRRYIRSGRTFNSVFLPAELETEIQRDLKTFTESRKRLKRLELPWRRGYLLSGPPGTGKTSLSLTIAASLNFNLATLSLTDIQSDGELRKAVAALRGSTVLVIEDIDAYSISHDRDHNAAKDGALSLSGLLNSLDGFETPDGLVTIATTNHIEHLDPALIRSGRLDRTFTLDHIQAPELERLFTWFYEAKPPTEAPENTFDAKLSPAEATELFKQNLDEPELGWQKVLDRINNTIDTPLEAAA